MCIRDSPDADPATATDPNNQDTDGGLALDGDEDANQNGAVDSGERDPNLDTDDCPRSFCNGSCGERNLEELQLNMDGAAGAILDIMETSFANRRVLAAEGFCQNLSRRRFRALQSDANIFYSNVWSDVWNSLISIESSACEGFNSQCTVNDHRDLTDRIEENLINLRRTARRVLNNRCDSGLNRIDSLVTRRRSRLIRRINRHFRSARLSAVDYPNNAIDCQSLP